MPSASATESLQIYESASAVSDEATEAVEVTETTEKVATEEEADVSMTDEEATATRAHLLRGLATTDTEALLHRAELTATSQAAHTETIHPDAAAAARPPTTAPEAVPPLLLPDAAAIPPAYAPPHRRLASHAGAATTDQFRAMSPTAEETREAKATAVTKAADPVRVLLLTSVAHDRPDVTANPTTPAAVDRLRTIADPLRPRNATAELHRQSLARRLVGVAMLRCQGPDHAHAHAHAPAPHRGVATSMMTRSFYRAPTDVTSTGSAKVTKQGGAVAAAALVAHHPRPAKRWTMGNDHTKKQRVLNNRLPPMERRLHIRIVSQDDMWARGLDSKSALLGLPLRDWYGVRTQTARLACNPRAKGGSESTDVR